MNESKQPTPQRLDTTIVKGMRIMETLARSSTPMGVTQLAREVGLEKSNVHRILGTLIELGYVRRHAPTARYQLSLRLWEFGAVLIGRSRLRRVARPFMRQLNLETSEFVYLTILSGSDILYIDTVEAAFPLGAGIVPGTRVPVVFPASGKVLLAYQPEAETLIDSVAIPEGRTLDRDALLRELMDIKRSGYAISVSGWTIGRNSVAAPIITGGDPPMAALGVGGPTERMAETRLLELSASVRNAATGIAEALGAIEADALI